MVVVLVVVVGMASGFWVHIYDACGFAQGFARFVIEGRVAVEVWLWSSKRLQGFASETGV